MPVQPAVTVRPIPKPEPIPSTSAPAPIGATTSGEVLAVALADISAGWPEAVRREISRDGLEKAKCELPAADIGGPLKHGLLQFPWQQGRASPQPPPAPPAPPPTPGTILHLPLPII